MKLYTLLSKIKFISKSYSLKFLFVAFLGIHIPLIGLIFFVIFTKDNLSEYTILLITLFFTLLATSITLIVLRNLIMPIECASKSLINYLENRKLPDLPTNHIDEAGKLMANISKSICEYEEIRLEKEDFSHLLSHDLKNFTGNTITLSNFILKEDKKENITKLATLINENTKQQLIFIETVIKLIQQESIISRVDYVYYAINLEKTLKTINDRVQPKLLNKNIDLQIQSNVNKIDITLNEFSLIQVIVNLLDNAIKFSKKEGKISLKINLFEKILRITVTDFGIGFEPENCNEIFKKFTKISKLGTDNEASIGIGLYLSRKIIEKSGGQLSGYSEGVNKGATFTIDIVSK